MFENLPASTLVSGKIELTGIEPILNLDTNSDGKKDFSIKASATDDPRLYIRVFERIVKDMKLHKDVTKSILEELDEIDDALKEYLKEDDEDDVNEKKEKVIEEINEFLNKLSDPKWKKGKLTEIQRENLIKLAEGISF